MGPAGWVEIGARRIENILRRLPIATMRTLENKISDAGPPRQRVEPHHLSAARRKLEQFRMVTAEQRGATPWYRLTSAPEQKWRERLERVGPILDELHRRENTFLVGKTLEVAVFRTLQEQWESDHGLPFLGGFQGLNNPDEKAWAKVEPPSMISGRSLTGDKKLDFVVIHPDAGLAGIEVKNTREWVYPDRGRMLTLLAKCCELDAVPVMICRRYPYVTFSVLHRCGVLLHQNYNQLLPESMRHVAEQARHKDLLGYHDIRVGTQPDGRLRRFIGSHLPRSLPQARERFNQYRDLLCAFASQEMKYAEFVARARHREDGMPEDSDCDVESQSDYY